MSTFAGNEKWRNHPKLRPQLKNFFPGFTWALAAVIIVNVAERFYPAEQHGSGHDSHAAHAAGELKPDTSAAKKGGDGGQGVH